MLIYTSHYFKNFDSKKYYTVQISSATLPNKKPDVELDILYPPDDLRLKYKKSVIKWHEYSDAYNDFLKTIDLEQLKSKLYSIQEEAQKQDKDILFVCWESNKDFCHRSLISQFIKEKFNIDSNEI